MSKINFENLKKLRDGFYQLMLDGVVNEKTFSMGHYRSSYNGRDKQRGLMKFEDCFGKKIRRINTSTTFPTVKVGDCVTVYFRDKECLGYICKGEIDTFIMLDGSCDDGNWELVDEGSVRKKLLRVKVVNSDSLVELEYEINSLLDSVGYENVIEISPPFRTYETFIMIIKYFKLEEI